MEIDRVAEELAFLACRFMKLLLTEFLVKVSGTFTVNFHSTICAFMYEKTILFNINNSLFCIYSAKNI